MVDAHVCRYWFWGIILHLSALAQHAQQTRKSFDSHLCSGHNSLLAQSNATGHFLIGNAEKRQKHGDWNPCITELKNKISKHYQHHQPSKRSTTRQNIRYSCFKETLFLHIIVHRAGYITTTTSWLHWVVNRLSPMLGYPYLIVTIMIKTVTLTRWNITRNVLYSQNTRKIHFVSIFICECICK